MDLACARGATVRQVGYVEHYRGGSPHRPPGGGGLVKIPALAASTHEGVVLGCRWAVLQLNARCGEDSYPRVYAERSTGAIGRKYQYMWASTGWRSRVRDARR